MRYLKKYDNFRYRGEWIYFKLFVDNNIEKYRLAIEKTGYADLFYKCYYLSTEDNIKNFVETIIYMVFNPKNDIPGRCQCEFYIEDDKYLLDNYNNLIYGGEIHVSDEEIAAKKYNI